MDSELIDEYTEGMTSDIEYTLKHKNPITGAESTFNATGMTPAVVLKNKNGTVVDTSGDVSWADAPNSKIRYTPDAGDLSSALSPYTLKWKVTDVGGKIGFYPQGAAIKLIVHSQ